MIYSKISNQNSAPFVLPELPYVKEALEPYLTLESFDFHHGKHHNAYVTNLNKFLEENSGYDNMDLESIILKSHKESDAAIFNNAAQVWNHTFFWHSMKPSGGGLPSGAILEQINKDFGSFAEFTNKFKQAGISQFGSGWVWLVYNGDKLEILKTSNADTPITSSLKPIICCDVWEHAYYIDFRNRRPDFLALFIEKLVNWNFASENFDDIS